VFRIEKYFKKFILDNNILVYFLILFYLYFFKKSRYVGTDMWLPLLPALMPKELLYIQYIGGFM
jgi:hypothetical protein